jgi:TM2 domain-containing membrane protein YozV
MFLSRKGQNTIEYLLFFTAIIAALIFFVAQSGSPYKNQLNQTYELGTNALETVSNTFYNSF